MAISYLFTLLGEEALSRRLPFLEGVGEAEVRLVVDQIRKGIHAPMTSGAGRLFDGIAALTGVRGRIDYEGQAAVELEMACDGIGDRKEAYPFPVREKNGEWVIGLGDLFSAVLADLGQGVPTNRISARFHWAVALLIARMCGTLSRSTGIRQVALSGGVFQNRILSRLTWSLLKEGGMEVFTHREIPCNDACVSLGQAVVAHFSAQETGGA